MTLSKYLPYSPTPVQEITNAITEKAAVRLLVKREDLNHPLVSGNKWWKLKHNILAAQQQGFEKIVTFGGAYSNHIYATAAATFLLGLKSIGVIRGEETKPLNHTLAFAKEHGMQLKYISRSIYRQRSDMDFLEQLRSEFGAFFLVPEGGTNTYAVKGIQDFCAELKSLQADAIVTPVGTAGTLCGLITGMPDKKILGVPVLKESDFLYRDIGNLLRLHSDMPYTNWELIAGYHFGGYAKVTKQLLDFTNDMARENGLPLDPVYTAKMFFGIFQEIMKGRFNRGETILAIHTGGLQGALSFVGLKQHKH